MNDIVRWGVIGNARIAREALIPAIRKTKNAELTAIASRSTAKATEAAEAADTYGFRKFHDSYEALLRDPDVDAVYIPLPNGLHAEWTVKAAQAGKHVLCEKPAALTAVQAQRMVEACHENDVVFMEAFMYQFHPQHERVRAIVASGEIGEVRLMHSRFAFQLGDPGNVRFDRELGGGALYDVGCYCIHASRHILGAEPSRVYAQAHADPDIGVDLTTAGMLSFDHGLQASFDCSFETAPGEFFDVIGDKGRIHVQRPYRPDKNEDGQGHIAVTTAEGESRVERVAGDSYVLQVEHFSQCVLDHTEPACPGKDTVRNMRVIDACHESIRSGQAVSLSF